MKKILVLDNYDSFTYNIVHIVKKITDAKVEVYRNDKITLKKIENFNKIILSPGPGVPDEANILKPLIKRYANSKSIFGVCLGQQAIAEVFGGKLINSKRIYHGVSSLIEIIDDKEILFNKIPKKIKVGRYHSWVISQDMFPSDLKITALGSEKEIMAIRHKNYDVSGVQFHPESILTPYGFKIIENWLKK